MRRGQMSLLHRGDAFSCTARRSSRSCATPQAAHGRSLPLLDALSRSRLESPCCTATATAARRLSRGGSVSLGFRDCQRLRQWDQRGGSPKAAQQLCGCTVLDVARLQCGRAPHAAVRRVLGGGRRSALRQAGAPCRGASCNARRHAPPCGAGCRRSRTALPGALAGARRRLRARYPPAGAGARTVPS
jgi:hypothetical protein